MKTVASLNFLLLIFFISLIRNEKQKLLEQVIRYLSRMFVYLFLINFFRIILFYSYSIQFKILKIQTILHI